MHSRTHKAQVIVLAILALTLTACKSSSDLSSPGVTLRKFYDAMKKQDVAGFRRTLSARMNKHIDEVAKSNPAPTYQPAGLAEMIKPYLSAEMPETRNEKINGEKATLEVNTLYN